uniref:Serpin domain-containing protein n=2 Tax=Clastoptera arizonana TaxID=38151 RepID=A0A1B6CLW2_9HEMI
MQVLKTVCLLVLMMTHTTTSSLVTEGNLVVQSSNNFSNNVYMHLIKSGGNVLYCPISAHVLLSLVYLGAKGKTAHEMKIALQIKYSDKVLKNSYKKILNGIHHSTLNIVIRIYSKIGVKVKPDFISTSQNYFASYFQEVDFTKRKETAQLINTFVQDQTKDTIKDFVKADSLHNALNMILVNAAHFKSDWIFSFSKAVEGDFYVSKTQKVIVEMMNTGKTCDFKSSSTLNSKLVRIHFKNLSYSMIIVLPNKIDGLCEVELKLQNQINEIFHGYSTRVVNISIPKFKIETEINLLSVLKYLGMKLLFSTEANLSGLLYDPTLVDRVLQKTYIDVNEYGVDVAASTLISVEFYSGIFEQETFVADHPFLFFITFENLIIFQGRFVKPN